MKCNNCNRDIGDAAVCPFCHTVSLRQSRPHHLPPGTVISGRYRIEGVLGEGGFGVTYLGYNTNLGMAVAVKEYFPHGFSYRNTADGNTVFVSSENNEKIFARGRERFLREAKTLVRFNSEPGVVSAIDFVEENNTAYLIMEYLEGVTLQQYLLHHGPIGADETISLLDPVIKTLEKIHAAGIIHRDISPDNIMWLNNGQLKLMDFGAAKVFVDNNRTMSVLLKSGYAPLEQYRKNGEQGPWTDVYALCATIYRCITGKTPDDALDRVVDDKLQKPSELGANITPAFEEVLMRGLAVNKQDRCQNMTELSEQLKQAQSECFAPKVYDQNESSAMVGQDRIVNSEPDAAVTTEKEQAAADLTVSADDSVEDKAIDGNDRQVPPNNEYATMIADKDYDDSFSRYNESEHRSDSKGVSTGDTVKHPIKKRKPSALIVEISVVVLIVGVLITAGVLLFDYLSDDSNSSNFSDYGILVMDDNTAEIIKYRGSGIEIKIPENINGYKVTSIGEYAFKNCNWLKSVTIPDSFTSIGNSAFEQCSNLSSVTFPDSVTSIGNSAFYQCSNLSSVTIPDSVTSIGNSAFYQCSNLSSVTIPDSVTIIGDSTFEQCDSLKSVTIPDSVTNIGDDAFLLCDSLASVTIPDSVTNIGDDAFACCDDLVMYGKKGSMAEEYAHDNGITFVEI